MSAEWPEFQLGERCIVKSSKRIFASEYVEKGIPFMRSKDVIDKTLGSFVDYDLYISEERFSEIQQTHGSPARGDLLMSSVGNRSGQPYVIQNEGDFHFKDGNILWLSEFEDINSDYLAYWLKSEIGQDALTSVMIGSAQKALTIDSIRKLWVRFPPIEYQDWATKILLRLDQKIELNRQTNQTLEHITQAIFKNWFVDFEPTRAKIIAKEKGGDELAQELAAQAVICGAITLDELAELEGSLFGLEHDLHPLITERFPNEFGLDFWQPQQLAATAALFPNSLVGSELGEMPKGWRDGSIGDVAKAKGGYAFKGKSFVEEGNPVIKIKNITGDGRVDLTGAVCIDDEQAKYSERFKLNDGDLLMAMTGATVGKIGFVFTGGQCVYLNQRVAKFESERFGPKISWFLFCCFERDSIFDSVVGAAQGSAQPNISSSGIESINLILSSNDLIEVFCEKTDSLFKKWLSSINENAVLNISRDVLLPKLLSGELSATA